MGSGWAPQPVEEHPLLAVHGLEFVIRSCQNRPFMEMGFLSKQPPCTSTHTHTPLQSYSYSAHTSFMSSVSPEELVQGWHLALAFRIVHDDPSWGQFNTKSGSVNRPHGGHRPGCPRGKQHKCSIHMCTVNQHNQFMASDAYISKLHTVIVDDTHPATSQTFAHMETCGDYILNMCLILIMQYTI